MTRGDKSKRDEEERRDKKKVDRWRGEDTKSRNETRW